MQNCYPVNYCDKRFARLVFRQFSVHFTAVIGCYALKMSSIEKLPPTYVFPPLCFSHAKARASISFLPGSLPFFPSLS